MDFQSKAHFVYKNIMISIHTYKHKDITTLGRHYNIALSSHPMLCVLSLYMSGGNYSLISRQIFFLYFFSLKIFGLEFTLHYVFAMSSVCYDYFVCAFLLWNNFYSFYSWMFLLLVYILISEIIWKVLDFQIHWTSLWNDKSVKIFLAKISKWNLFWRLDKEVDTKYKHSLQNN